jgi:signal transduction histidine kinase
VTPGPNSPLLEALSKTSRVQLTYDQARNVGLDFVALHFKNSEMNRYAYRLEGFDADWIQAGAQRSATYTNLPPGEYTFHVKAANSDGIWNEEGAVLQLVVLPPWWRTLWAYLAYGLFLVGAVAATDRFQRRRLRKRTQLEQAELRAHAAESEKEAAQAKTQAIAADFERKKDAELLGEIGKELTSTLDLETIFNTVYEHVNQLVDAPVFGVGLYDNEQQQIEYRLAIENGVRYAPYRRDMSDKNQLPVWCIEHRAPVFVNDIETEYKNYIDQYSNPGGQLEDGSFAQNPQSLIYLPLITKDRVLGVLSVQSFRKDAYTEHDLNILRALATYTAIAVDNADAYRRLNSTFEHLREAQQQLVQQEKLASLGQLTAGIAHEIKNPLNFVTNFSALNEELSSELEEALRSSREHLPEKTYREMEDLLTSLRVNSGHVAKHGRRADSIVKSMMEHASGGQGERYPVDVNAFLEEYVNLAYHGRRAQTPGFNVTLERHFEDGVGSVEMAPQELGRVIVNLLTNAFDAVAEKGRKSNGEYTPCVAIRTVRRDGHVDISVEDNGPGIPGHIRARIFEPFFTTKPTGSGTGLGLSLSYDIVSQGHGGQLTVASEEGSGTVFTVALPAKSA